MKIKKIKNESAKEMFSKRAFALSHIVLLILGTIAIAYTVGSNFETVSAQQQTQNQCAQVGTSYWQVVGNNVRCVPGHCSPSSYAGKDWPISWFCATHLEGSTFQGTFCSSTGGGSRLTWSINTNNLIVCPAEDATTERNPGATSGSPGEGGIKPRDLVEAALTAAGLSVTDRAVDWGLEQIGLGKKIEEAIAEEAVKEGGSEILQAAVTEEVRDTWLQKAFKKINDFYKPEQNSLSQALKNSAITSGAAGALAFLTTAIGTGDLDHAWRVGLRVTIGAEIGYLAGYGLSTGLQILGIAAGPVGWLIGGAQILGAIFSKFLSREQDRTLIFQCMPWKAETGGENCEECNDKDFPCTEYQCRSLGAGCELANKDTSEPRCVWKDPRNLDPPEITPWTDVLAEGYSYNPLPRGQYGVEIKYQNQECLPAFTPFALGVELDKEGYCKIEYSRTSNFSEMKYNFGGKNSYLTQHAQIMSFPGAANIQDYLEELNLEEDSELFLANDGEFEIYVRCESANGRSNREEFSFEFCIDKEDDTTSPTIRGFNWGDNSPISYFSENELREVDIQVYTNEPAQCKWDHEDKSYESMVNSLSCQDSLISFNAQLSYTCSGKLTGLQNRQNNDFYFRCNDTSGNVNQQSEKLILIGTQPLFIDEVSPNDLIKGSTDLIKVTIEARTSAGSEEGVSECSYRSSETSNRYVKFSSTNSHTHSTNVWLGPGDYSYDVRCIDLGGNADTEQTSFVVETDTEAPNVVRAFHQENKLKIITDEPAICVYSDFGCNYPIDQGTLMTTSDDVIHSADWRPDKNFYIKCYDEFGNQPLPNQCSITVRPFQI